MDAERIALRGDPAVLASNLRARVPSPQSVADAVAEIVRDVRERGEAAVLQYTSRFDLQGRDAQPVAVEEEELARASSRLDPAVREALERAIEDVSRVAQAQLSPQPAVRFTHHQVNVREEPVQRAAVYVPGGRAPYPSTVVMGVTTARVAGVDDVVVCSPPGAADEIDDVVLAACRLAGASAAFRMGGAQAIAALAYGTASVQPVEVIVGPGNLYVQEAKRQVSDLVGIEGFAGPSDLMVIATAEVSVEPIVLDLLAQAEHGPGTLVVAVSRSAELLDKLDAGLSQGPDSGAVACLVEVSDVLESLALAQAFAPEHLELVGPEAERLAERITRAGCLFVGESAGSAFGDYIVGSNHVLPTGGAARFASMLGPEHFRRRFAEVRIADGDELARLAAPLARAEGFELHARSMEVRIRDND